MFERYCVKCPLRKSEIKKQIHEEGHVSLCSNCDSSCFYESQIKNDYSFKVPVWEIQTIDTKDGFIQIETYVGEKKYVNSINHYDGKRMKSFDFNVRKIMMNK